MRDCCREGAYMKISKMIGREIYDSRGWPTIQCEITLEDGTAVVASVPAGLSRGRYEAREMRDGGKRLWGKGVLKAIENLESIIAPEIVGKEPDALEMDFKIIEMDGTPDKSHLGSNATLAASMAIYKAQARVEKIELYELIAYVCGASSVSLPFPLFNIVNGGVHANNDLQIQEFMIVPVASENFRSSMELTVMLFHEFKNILQRYGKSTAVGDEGGFAPQNVSDIEVLDMLCEALEKVEQVHGNRCVIALDIAASRFYDPATRTYEWEGAKISSEDLIAYYAELIESYPIYSIEDGLSEDDWGGWSTMMQVFDNKIQLVADDLFVTNPLRIAQGVKDNVASGVIIKPNQIGTVSEALQAIKLCKNNGLNIIVSHRSGETCDSFIADLAVGASAGQIKAGGCSRSERLSKYNRLLTIEDKLTSSLLD